MTGLTLIAAWFLSVISSLATVAFDENMILWIALVVTGLSYGMYAFFHARGTDGMKVFTIIGLCLMLISHFAGLVFLQTKQDGSEKMARSLVRCTAMLNNIVFTVMLIVHNQEWVNTCMGKLEAIRGNITGESDSSDDKDDDSDEVATTRTPE